MTETAEEPLAGQRHPGQPAYRFQRVRRTTSHVPHRARRVGRVGLGELPLLQLGVQAVVVRHHAQAGHGRHAARHAFEGIEAERGGAGLGRALNQPQRNARLDAHGARVSGEEAGQVRSVPAEERRGSTDRSRPGAQQLAIAQHHVEGQHRFRGQAVIAGAHARGILRSRSPDGGFQAGERPPERGAQLFLRQRSVEPFPGHRGFDSYVHVRVIDFHDAVQARGFHQQGLRRHRQVAVGVGSAAPPGHKSDVVPECDPRRFLQLVHRPRPNNRQRHFPGVVDVGREIAALGIVRDHVIVAQQAGKFLKNLLAHFPLRSMALVPHLLLPAPPAQAWDANVYGTGQEARFYSIKRARLLRYPAPPPNGARRSRNGSGARVARGCAEATTRRSGSPDPRWRCA